MHPSCPHAADKKRRIPAWLDCYNKIHRRAQRMKMKRVFLKLSGEALAGPKKTGFDEDTVKEVARR